MARDRFSFLKLEERGARITFEKAVLDASNEPALEKLYERHLA